MTMKRYLPLWPLWLGLLAFAPLPAVAQMPTLATTGKIHGHVTNPTGAPQTSGTVSLSTDGGKTAKFSFPVEANGDYQGADIVPGTYLVVFRQPDTPPDKMVDSFDGIKIVAGQDLVQDVDMSRKAFIDKLPPETQKQLEDLRKHNSEALKANAVIGAINADVKVVVQDLKDSDLAKQAASQQLGATASAAAIATKEDEIKTAKFTEIETLMLKDTQLRPVEPSLWVYLGQGQVGLKKYDAAEPTLKKALELDAASKKPSPAVSGLANSELGEVYARTGKVPEANAAYDAAAKANPAGAVMYFKNESVIFSQVGNGDAQAAAADEGIKTDPSQPIFYYLKAQALVAKATVDDKTKKYVLPPGCAEAYEKYLELAPTGLYAADAKAILEQAGQKVSTTYKAGKKS
jgi:tetratricopeptide (TPR) repeat protein